MNPFEILKSAQIAVKVIDGAAKVVPPLVTAIQYPDGKDCVGEFYIRDKRSKEWLVKVRETGKRGQYIKLEAKVGNKEIRASADNYKPEKYKRITSQEWSTCAEYALGDSTKYSQVMAIVSKIIQ